MDSQLLGAAGEIIARTGVVYLFLLIGLRLLGRGEVAQLRSTDLVLLLVLANSVQNAMVGSDTTLFGGLVAAGTLLVLTRAIRIVEGRFPRLRRSIEGEPILLARNGVVSSRGLALAEMSRNDLLVAARRAGIASLDRVQLAILESDGTVSVISRGASTRRPGRPRSPKRARG